MISLKISVTRVNKHLPNKFSTSFSTPVENLLNFSFSAFPDSDRLTSDISTQFSTVNLNFITHVLTLQC